MLDEWLIYAACFIAMLSLDFYVTRSGVVSLRKSLTMSGFYVLCALSFGVYIFFDMGVEPASQFLTIYSLEQMLSVDNLLIISLIFGFFAIPKEKQHKALLYGILGAIFFRVLFISLGAALIAKFAWILYIFAAVLIWTGYQIMRSDGDDSMNPEEKKFIVWIKNKFGPAGAFIGCIVAIELTDIMFAIDSIPASFSVSQDPYIILTANLFAVLGLRSLFHAVQHGISFFEGIEKYIGFVLVLLGVEVFVHHMYADIPSWVTMGAVFAVLTTGVIASMRKKKLAAQAV